MNQGILIFSFALIISSCAAEHSGAEEQNRSGESELCQCLGELSKLTIAFEQMDRNSDEYKAMRDKVDAQKANCDTAGKRFTEQFRGASDEEKEMKVYMEMMNCQFVKEQTKQMLEGVIDGLEN
jgi:hypothetical protein